MVASWRALLLYPLMPELPLGQPLSKPTNLRTSLARRQRDMMAFSPASSIQTSHRLIRRPHRQSIASSSDKIFDAPMFSMTLA